MSEQRAADLRRLFGDAVRRSAEDRSAWLRQNCPDPELRGEVEALLAAVEARGRELDDVLAELPAVRSLAGGSSRVQRELSGEPDAELIGQEVGHYQILQPLGRGGMGVVYKARDTRLERTVALKFLPSESLRSSESRARFLREAQAASALDHPSICTIHEIAESGDGRPFIVMAYVEGETVRDKIARRPLPLAEAIDVASRVALGLAAAHERGIVHRDVKPANVMVTESGQVKVLDFGLAKVRDVSLTRTGVTLGTIAYMSPEQLAGEGVDRRTDIWALGVLLYEMVTGHQPFRGSRTEAIVAAILTEDPEPMTALRSDVPLELDRIVAKALAKDPRERYQHIDEIPVDLRRALGPGTAGGPAPARSTGAPGKAISRRVRSGRTAAIAALLGALAGASIWHAFGSRADHAARPVSFVVPFPPGWQPDTWNQLLAVTPDGARVVFTAQKGDQRRLYLRNIDRLESVAIDGTDGGTDPFFSPDGRWLGFFAGGQLKKVELDGGIPQIICDAPNGTAGATWGPDGTIVFSLGITSGLAQVSADGGTPTTLTVPKLDAGEIGHYWPQYLPGGRGLLFTIWSATGWRTAVLPAGASEWRVVLEGGAGAQYLPTGHLLFARMSVGRAEPGLLVAPFDRSTMEVTGAAVSVLEDPGLGGPTFAVSSSGTLVYLAGGSPVWVSMDKTSLVFRNEDGGVTPALAHPGYFESPRLSPDGTRIAVPTISAGGTVDTWVYDLERGTSTRVTLTGSINNYPVWTPDGRSLAFNSSRVPAGIYRKAADGSGTAELLVRREAGPQIPGSWSPDGSTLVYTLFDDQRRGDIWVVSSKGARPLLATEASELAPAFSPDGSYLAYVSNRSGRDEVYLRHYPLAERSLVVSTEGGREPAWAPSGRTLFYRAGDAVMSVTLPPGPELRVGRPRVVFTDKDNYSAWGPANYDVASDGRLLWVQRVAADHSTRLVVVLNWFTDLKRLVPGAN